MCIPQFILLYQYRKEKNDLLFFIGIGFLGGFLMSIRATGICFILAICIELAIDLLQGLLKKKSFVIIKKVLMQKIIIILTAGIMYILLNVILFKIPSNGFAGYIQLFDFNSLSIIISENLAYYFEILKSFFIVENLDWQFASILTQSILLSFAVIGMVKKFFDKFDFIDAITIFYFLIILCYPYNHGGLRFLFPIMPLLLYYAVITAKDINISIKFLNRKVLICLIGFFVLLQYKVSICSILEQQDTIIAGPQEIEAAEAFNYIEANVPADAIIDFFKPRALALYTNKNGFTHKDDKTIQDLKQIFNTVGVSYILYNEPYYGYLGSVLKVGE